MIPRNKISIICILISIIIAGINFTDLSTSFIKEETRKTQNSLTLALFNVKTDNTNYHKVLSEIKENNPDIILLQEVNDIWLTAINELKEKYPYHIEKERFDNFRIALYSKIPFKDYQIEDWSEYEVPVIKATISLKEKDITIYGIHTLPPVSSEYFSIRNIMFQKMQNIILEKQTNLIIAGDFNSTKFSPSYKKYISSTKINDSLDLAGNINIGSWNAYHIAPMRITLEHILSTKDIIPLNYTRGKFIGSDHFPIFVELGY